MRNTFQKMTTQMMIVAVVSILGTLASDGQEKSRVERALSYKPVQRDVDYDIPTKSEIASCKMEKAAEKFQHPGFVVYDPSGRLLRLFFDTNGDNDLDYWAYFKDGIEVYRDLDSDFDGRADQFRWMGSGGLRHGDDSDGNGTIDRWLLLSASELAEEAFQAIRTSDAARFRKLLPTSTDLKELNLGANMNSVVSAKVREASGKFESFARKQRVITERSKWTQFGTSRPSLVPEGLQGIEQDIVIFDHAAAVFENAGEYGQVSLGTIIEVAPNNWRLVELPQLVGEGQIVRNGGLFYPSTLASGGNSAVASAADGPQAAKMTALFEKFDDLEKQLKAAKGAAAVAKLEERRAELLLQLALESTEKADRQNWIRQLVDTVTSSYQLNKFPGGVDFLQGKISKIKAAGLGDQIPYLQWRTIYANFSQGHQNGDRRDRIKANERYISDLEGFVKDFPRSEFSADALFQLGLNAEVTSRDDIDSAVDWYKKCSRTFPKTVFGKKAAGALLRLTSTGKSLPLKGMTLNGKRFDLQSSQLRGKIVIIHYWETWCDTCIEGFEELQRLGAKYNRDIQIIGANLDQDTSKVKSYLAKNRSLNWPQLHSPGGVEKSPLAVQLGVATLPMTILVDQRGNLVESNVPVDDLDREIQRLLRRGNGQANRRGATR